MSDPSDPFPPKEQWGHGPWTNEPDHEVWIDPDTDYPCILHRFRGTWCGYVGVPPDHPASGLSYNGIPQATFDALHEAYHQWIVSGRVGERPKREGPGLTPAGRAIADIEVHGGLIFSGICESLLSLTARCRNWHFFGFDCNRAGDFDPQMDAYWRDTNPKLRRRFNGFEGGSDEVYRDINYAREECRKLAAQLAVIK